MRLTLLGLAIAGASCAASAADLSLSSPDIAPEKIIAEKYVLNSFGCTGGNVSPALNWKNVPPGTKSLAVTVYDPDAPTGSGWWHWVVYDIPPQLNELPSGIGNSDKPQLPGGGLQGRTDFGKPGWGGPCSRAGDKPHRYIFTLHALSTPKLNVPAAASGALIGYMIHLNEIAKTQFMARYGR